MLIPLVQVWPFSAQVLVKYVRDAIGNLSIHECFVRKHLLPTEYELCSSSILLKGEGTDMIENSSIDDDCNHYLAINLKKVVFEVKAIKKLDTDVGTIEEETFLLVRY